jgi:hypothetical protein
MGDQPCRKAATYTEDNTNAEETRTNIHASRGFEPMIPVFERTKTVHALDHAATVIGYF